MGKKKAMPIGFSDLHRRLPDNRQPGSQRISNEQMNKMAAPGFQAR